MLLVLVCSHDSFNCGSTLHPNLILLLLLQHQIVHALLTEFADLPVFLLPGLLNLVLAALLQLDHVASHAKTVLVPLLIFEPLLL